MELARKATGIRPGIKVLYMSGFTDLKVPENAFPAKAFHPETLERMVRGILYSTDSK